MKRLLAGKETKSNDDPTGSDNLKGTVVNRALSSFQKRLLEITLSEPLSFEQDLIFFCIFCPMFKFHSLG